MLFYLLDGYAYRLMAQRPDVGRTGTVRVSFVCQRCNQPLQLDDSFRALNDKIQAELTGNASEK